MDNQNKILYEDFQNFPSEHVKLCMFVGKLFMSLSAKARELFTEFTFVSYTY